MSRTIINFWLDCLLLLVFLLLVWISVVLRFVFPSPLASEGWTLWGWTYLQWSVLQFNVLCALVLGVLLHVMLHWSWVCGVVSTRLLRRRQGKKRKPDDGVWTLYGVGLMIVILNVMGLAIAAAALMIRNPIG
jgi:hypothetical protein